MDMIDLNNPKKWIVRAGTLLILLGFVLPVMTVSCVGVQFISFSLADLASEGMVGPLSQPILYLVPLAILAVLVLSFLAPKTTTQARVYYFGQVAGLVIGVLAIVIAAFSLYYSMGAEGAGMFQVDPEFGILLLMGGFLLVTIALVLLVLDPSTFSPGDEQYQPILEYQPPPEAPPAYPPPSAVPAAAPVAQPAPEAAAAMKAWLEVVRGDLPQRAILVNSTNFSIGRGPANNLDLSPDKSVSRNHARLRYAQGMWFIQDQNSRGGTYVEGQKIQAARLNPGANIKIGDYLFVFRTQ